VPATDTPAAEGRSTSTARATDPVLTEPDAAPQAAATSKRQRELGLIGREPAVRATLHDGKEAMLKAMNAAAKDKH